MRSFCSPCSSSQHHYRHYYNYCKRKSSLFFSSAREAAHSNRQYALYQSFRAFNTPGPLDFLTSPGGLLALLYGRVGSKEKLAPLDSAHERSKDKTERPVTCHHSNCNKVERSEEANFTDNNDVKSNNNNIHKEFVSDSHAALQRWGIDKSYFSKEVIVLAVVIFALSALWEFVQSKRGVLGQMCRNCCMTTLEVRSSQQEYTMIMDWMGRQERGKRLRNVALRPNSILDENEEENNNMESGRANEQRQLRTTFVPGYGSHFFMFGHTCMWIVRSEDASKQHGMHGTRVDRENDVLHLSFLTRDRDVVALFLEEVRKSWEVHVQRNVRVYMGSAYGLRWRLIAERLARPLSTLYFPSHIMELVEEINVFLSLKETYHALGIPWRRGYLFHGAPGTGKTSFALAIAGALHLSVYVLPLQTHDMDDETLLTIVSTLPPRSLLLIEDIENAIKLTDSHYDHPTTNDTAAAEATIMACKEDSTLASSNHTNNTNSTNGTNNGNNSKISLSALLNALDGVTCSEGRVLIITTNDVNRVPASHALLRPGRVDRIIHFDTLQPAEVQSMQSLFVNNLISNTHVPECIRVHLQKELAMPKHCESNKELESLMEISTTHTSNVEEQSPACYQQQLLNTVYRVMRQGAHATQELSEDGIMNEVIVIA